MNSSPNQPHASTSSTKLGLWTDILRSADRQNALGRKNLLILSERHHGRKQLIEKMVNSTSTSTSGSGSGSGSKRRKREIKTGKGGLAMGYEVMEIRDDADEESAPPLSIYYPPSSQKSFTKLVPTVLPPKLLSETAVMILLDWTKPSSMIKELLYWLSWVEEWAGTSSDKGQAEEMRDKLQSHIQHYVEPAAQPSGSTTSPLSTPALPSISSVYGSGPLLPLGQGTLTLNTAGLPIMVVCTKADLMDSVRDDVGMKGAGWEERTDWIQQVLRTICLAYGASLFYTAPTQPSTYTVLVQYLLHRLYTTPPPLNPPDDEPPAPSSTRFPFPHRANVLDRDAVLVPAGWDSWGKINVLREGFDTARVNRAWDASLSRLQDDDETDDREGIEDLWEAMIPNTERGPRTKNPNVITTTSEPEQSFLSKQLDQLQRDPRRDPRQSFRTTLSNTVSSSGGGNTVNSDGGGVVGPMGGSGLGLNLPGVEKAMIEMEGSGLTGEDLKEKFARLGRREGTKAGPLSPTGTQAPGTPSAPAVPNEALHNFFQGLLANKGKTAGKDKEKPAMSP